MLNIRSSWPALPRPWHTLRALPSCSFWLRRIVVFFGDIHEELPIAKATVSQHLKELKSAGLIQGEIEAPKVKYCINRKNWEIARTMFSGFFSQPLCKEESCCL